MSKLQTAPAIGGTGPGLFVRVERTSRPRLPWHWVVHRDGGTGITARSVRGYISAEEAWEAGRAALAGMGRTAGPVR
jgi:hypothetical protein